MTVIVKVDRSEIIKEIKLQAADDPDVGLQTRKFAEEVRDYWKDVAWPTSTGNHGPGVHPYDTGAYRDSIQVKQNRVGGRFSYGWIVYTDHPDANFIEFGTGPDKPGSRSPWGPNTPTPAFYPAAKTAIEFGGTAP